MILTPGGPYAVDDPDGLLRCFDETGASAFAFVCRLVGGDRAVAERVLAEVYVRLGTRTPAHASAVAVADSTVLNTIAVATAQELAADRWSEGSSVRERALTDLGIVDGRPLEEIAAILALPVADVADRLEALVHQHDDRDAADRLLRADESWFDDETRDRVRLAIADGVGRRGDVAATARVGEAASSGVASRRAIDRIGRPQSTQPSASGERRPSNRWKVGAVLGIAGMLTAGFFWVTPDRDDGAKRADEAVDTTVAAADTTDTTDTAGTSDTVAPSTTVVDDDAPTTTQDPYVQSGLQLSPGFVLATVPSGFRAAGLSEVTADQDTTSTSGAWIQLWAEPDASRTTGRWLAMSTTTRPAQNDVDESAVRQRFAGLGYSGLRRTAPDGVVEMTLSIGSDPARTVGMAAFGLAEAELISIATSLEPFSADGEGPGLNRSGRFVPSSVGMAVLHGMEVIEAGPTYCCGIHAPGPPADQRWVYYAGTDDPSGSSYISIGTTDSIARSLFERFDDPTGSNPDVTSTEQTVQVGDRLVHLTEQVVLDPTMSSSYSSAWWTEQNQRITVSASVPAADLVVLIGSIRRATAEEWLDIHERTFRVTNVTSGEFHVPVRQPIGDVALDDQVTWSLIVEPESNTAELDQGSTGSGVRWSSSDLISEYSSMAATVLIISVPDPPPGTRARVTVAGRDPTIVDLVPLEGGGRWVGFDAFTQLPPYTVELVDEAGNVTQLLNP